MVRGCMSAKGPGNLHFSSRGHNGSKYVFGHIEAKFIAKRKKNWITEIIQILSG